MTRFQHKVNMMAKYLVTVEVSVCHNKIPKCYDIMTILRGIIVYFNFFLNGNWAPNNYINFM